MIPSNRITHLADIYHRAEMSNGSSVPSNWVLASTGSNKGITWTPQAAAAGAVSYGSNAMDVNPTDNGGASTDVSRMDHRHRGVRLISSSGSNSLVGDINFVGQGSVGVTVSGQTIQFSGTSSAGGGGGSALTIKDEGTPLATDATSIDFVGAGVTASGATGAKTVTIPGPVGMVIVIPLIINGAGAVLGTGVAGDLTIPFGCTVTAWRALADQTGSVAVSIWKDVYANYPPVVGDLMLTASITTSSFNEATGLSHTITAGDTLRYNVDSVTTITRVLISLTATRTS